MILLNILIDKGLDRSLWNDLCLRWANILYGMFSRAVTYIDTRPNH